MLICLFKVSLPKLQLIYSILYYAGVAAEDTAGRVAHEIKDEIALRALGHFSLHYCHSVGDSVAAVVENTVYLLDKLDFL